MIASITKGRGFRSLFEYLLNPDKEPTILVEAQGCLADTPAELTTEFELIAASRPTVRKPVRHFSIGFAPEDGEIDNHTKSLIALKIIATMGYGGCQYLAVAHGRDDPDHPQPHNHDHMHIVTNAVDLKGQLVSDFWDYPKLEKSLRSIEKEFGLRQIACSWEKPIGSQRANLEIQAVIEEALVDKPTLPEWIDRLEKSSINLRFKLTGRDKIQGVSYIDGENLYKGGEIGYSWTTVRSLTTATSEDLAAIEKANTASNKLSIPLYREREVENELVIKLALQALQSADKLDHKRLNITRQNGVLTIKRLRPNKVALTAVQDKTGKWAVTGLSNIDKQDINVLSKIVSEVRKQNPISSTIHTPIVKIPPVETLQQQQVATATLAVANEELLKTKKKQDYSR